MTVVIAGPLRDKLEVIALREGLTLQQLAATACELLVESYGQPQPVIEKRGPGRPRKVPPVDRSADRCFVCDHTRGEHCGENGKCLSARCVCTLFYKAERAEP